MKHVLWVVLACARIAVAEPAPKSEADRLFREGIALFDAGKFDEACVKFEESIAKDPHAIGTLMNLGRCNERRGRVATALKRFQQAYDRASQANAVAMRDAAQERVAALTSQAPVVTLKRAVPALEGEKLVIDDEVIASDLPQILLDPGPHTLVIAAPGRLPFQTTFRAVASQTTVVELPELQLPKSGSTVRIRSSPRRVVGKIATLAGVGSALAAGALALYAKRDYDKQFEDPDGSGPRVAGCGPPPDSACNETAQARVDRDRTLTATATVVGVVGVTAAATGIVLWLTAPRDERATTVVPTVPIGNATGVGLAISGRF